MVEFNYVDPKTFKQAQDRTGMALRKQFSGVNKAVDVENRTVDFVVSTARVDRDGDTIDPSGFSLDAFRSNPVILFAHDQTQPPVAKAVSIEADGQALRSRAEFAAREVHSFADTVFQLIAGGFLNATSVGFIPKEFNFTNEENRSALGMDITSADLMEFSVVPVPSNPEALIQARSKGIDTHPMVLWAEQVLDQKTFDDERVEQAWKAIRKAEYFLIGENTPRSKVPASEAEVGRFYEWDASGGTAQGRADRVMTEGTLDVPDSSFSIDASEDDPAVLLTVYQERRDGFVPTETQVGHRASELRSIDPLPEPSAEEESRSVDGVTKPDVPADGPAPGETATQTLIFSRDQWTEAQARQWVREHDFRTDGFDEDERNYFFRQFNPSNCDQDSFATLSENFPSGLRMVICQGASEENRGATKATNFPTQGDDQRISLENSRFEEFDRSFAEMVADEYPEIWNAGGTEVADQAFQFWRRARNGSRAQDVLDWIQQREAWAARHFEDGRQFQGDDPAEPVMSNIGGVIAQMKWGVVGTLGQQRMKDVVNRVIEKRERETEQDGMDEQRAARLRAMAARARQRAVLAP